ncbi:LacI family DNA-binding transcriptional regulator [Aliiruegeria lutimaris]|uniref:Transcriptional regulator, LacI family n=1 Tax=Aliiruegeria lutimaris TaxID=571298 RepID=A0A1G8MN70_9RHOB|nr:LacI family DNA-binding transcriptional regulator [Aliiruegeria lutimaris]SDI69468.1 transcriptional regulator, LacI family [Aliiruegeria lutimaris]
MQPDDKHRRATIHDVARAAGVSAATVSKVLRGVKTVRAENAERVHKAVSELDYRMDPVASGLRGEQRRIIGAVVPDLESPFFGKLVTELESLAEAAGYHMIVASSRENEAREADLAARMNDWRVAGCILVPVRSERGPGAEKLLDFGMTAVLVDRVSADERFDTVSADNHEASASVADLLIGQQGHKHILLHGATRISKAIRNRLAGFGERARTLDPGVVIDELLSDEQLETQRAAIRSYFDGQVDGHRPTAIFSLSQHSTLLVLSEIRRMGLKIPEDVALVGFDDADWMQTTWPSITAVAQPVSAIAERALAALLARVEGEHTGFPVQYLEPCTLLVRQSAGQTETERPRRSGRSG